MPPAEFIGQLIKIVAGFINCVVGVAGCPLYLYNMILS